ncbi:MAG: hypothetical protein ACTSYF_12495, partial [Promethearchaeota archaeon]
EAIFLIHPNHWKVNGNNTLNYFRGTMKLRVENQNSRTDPAILKIEIVIKSPLRKKNTHSIT